MRNGIPTTEGGTATGAQGRESREAPTATGAQRRESREAPTARRGRRRGTRHRSDRRGSPGRLLACCGAVLLATPLSQAYAVSALPPISVGAGVRTDFEYTDPSGGGKKTDDFNLDSIRLYINDKVMDHISLM